MNRLLSVAVVFLLSLSAAGKTLHVACSCASDGRGEGATVELHFGMPASGSHEVLECRGGRTPFTMLQNFVHELRHARDVLTGQFRGHRAEHDAVDSENELRSEQGITGRRCLDREEDHIWQIWFPAARPEASAGLPFARHRVHHIR